MSLNPHCPKCRGNGTYTDYYYGDFRPRLAEYVCEDCIPHGKPTKLELILFGLGMLILALLWWGNQ